MSGGAPTVLLGALAGGQRAALEREAGICVAAIDTIEQFGGGGVRCMLAEVFLPRTNPADS